MRLRIEVTTRAETLPWDTVLAPGRGIAYDLLAQADPALGDTLHDHGWGPHRMTPFGHGAPVFPEAPRRRGAYAVGGKGYIEFGSPLPAVVAAWSTALRQRDLIDWGGTAFRIIGVRLLEPPPFDGGWTRMRTTSPVVLKAPGGDRPGGVWLFPQDQPFGGWLQHNLERKARTLGMTPDVELAAITWSGPKRSFAVGEGAKPGAAVEVELYGEPGMLGLLWSWGLGQANSAGFGWVGQTG